VYERIISWNLLNIETMIYNCIHVLRVAFGIWVGTWESLGKRLMDPYLFQFSFFISLIHLLFQHVIVSSQAERVSISFTYY